MKLQKRLLVWCLVFLLLATANCGPAQTPMVLITPSMSREATATFTPTPAISSQTPAASVVASATIATVAIVQTLETDQAYSFLQNLMQGSSKLPSSLLGRGNA